MTYFACCTVAYDRRVRSAGLAAVRLLRGAGLEVRLLGDDEVCCGDLAYRAGRSDIAVALAERNVASFEQVGGAPVVTSSPHCREAFVDWYDRLGVTGGSERRSARHVVEVLHEALGEGSLTFEGRYEARVAYHDPCYLGRHAGIYEQPRELLAAVPGVELVELRRNRERAVCCGGGGGGAFRETPQDERHALLRVDEALEVGAEVVATACPLCLLMFEDAIRVRGVEDRLRALDLCEVLDRGRRSASSSD